MFGAFAQSRFCFIKGIIITSDLNRISEDILKNKINISDSIVKDLKILHDLFHNIGEGYYKKDIKKLYTTNNKTVSIFESNLNDLSKKKETIIYHYYNEILRILYSIHSPLIGLTLAKTNLSNLSNG